MRLPGLVLSLALLGTGCASTPKPEPAPPVPPVAAKPPPPAPHVHTASCGHFLGYYRGQPAFEYEGLRTYWNGAAWVRLPDEVTEFPERRGTSYTPDAAYTRPGEFPLPEAPAPRSASELGRERVEPPPVKNVPSA